MIEVKEYVDVTQRATELGCHITTGLAVLPRNFASAASKDELLHEDTAPTVRTLWRNAGLAETPLELDGEHFPYVMERSNEWIGPIVFIGASMFSQNQHAISVSLSVIANYLTDFFRGRANEKVKLEVVVPQSSTNKYFKITYEGYMTGLKELPAVLKEVRNGRRPRRDRKRSR
jgi:hypothetical protein